MNDARAIIVKIEGLLLELRQKLKINQDVTTKKDVQNSRKISGVAGEIFDLAQAGFFENPKLLSEIQNKLRDEGVNKPTTALMEPILRLIRKKILDRSRSEKGQYQYFLRK